MNKLTTFVFASLIIALSGSNLSAAMTRSLLGLGQPAPSTNPLSTADDRIQAELILAGESTTTTKTTTTTTTSSSDDSANDSNSGDTDYHGVSYEGY